jgi:hypothetical protein
MYVHPDLVQDRHDDLIRVTGPSAPAVSFLPAFTTGSHGTGATIAFPQQYVVMFAVTVTATVVACALGALIAGRAGLLTVPAGLGLWMVTGFGMAIAGAVVPARRSRSAARTWPGGRCGTRPPRAAAPTAAG